MGYWTYILGTVALLIAALALYIKSCLPRRDWVAARDGNFQRAFLTHVAQDKYWAADPLLRETLCEILTSWSERNCGGVVLQEKSAANGSNNNKNEKFQMLDFYGPVRMRGGKPMVEIQWSYASNRQQALTFLNEERVETILCEPRVFRAMFEHLSHYCRYNGNIDVFSQCKVYEGYLCPSK